MNRKKIGILLTCLVTLLLWAVNRDLMHFEETFVYRRTFVPEEDGKGDVILSTEPLLLKSGTYRIEVAGNAEGYGSGVFLLDQDDEKCFAADFFGKDAVFEYAPENTRSVRFGVSYDPENGAKVTLDKVRFIADGVLYRGSVLRHGTVTLFVLLAAVFVFLRISAPNCLKKVFPFVGNASEEWGLVLLVGLTLTASFPLFITQTYIDGDDLYFHLRHIEGIAATLKNGYIPPRVHLSWLENYGYGAGFYYPNTFLTIPALFCILGFSTLSAYKIFLILCTFLSLLAIRKSVLAISSSSVAGNYAAILYAFAAYRLVDVYYRAALGEIQSFIFLPLIVWGLWEIFKGRTDRWYIFAFAFFGLLSSHVISLALAGIFTALFVLFFAPWWVNKKEVWSAFFKSVLLVAGLCAFFWMPMIEQMMTTQLKINGIIGASEAYGSYTNKENLLLLFNDWNYIEPARKVYPGWPLLLIPLLRLFFLRERSQIVRCADILTLFGAIAIIACTDLFPWQYFMRFLFRIQFAWRIMLIATVALCMSCAIYLGCMIRTNLLRWGAVVLLVSAAFGLPILLEAAGGHMLPMDYYRYVMRSNFLSGSEYLPVGFTRAIAEKNKDTVFADVPGTQIPSVSRRGLSVSFDFDSPEPHDSLKLVVPLIKYTGYQAEFTNSAGTRPLQIQTDETGRVLVDVGSAESGSVRVHYEKTAVQRISELISLLTLFIFVWKSMGTALPRRKSARQNGGMA